MRFCRATATFTKSSVIRPFGFLNDCAKNGDTLVVIRLCTSMWQQPYCCGCGRCHSYYGNLRMQQRSIPQIAIELLADFGSTVLSHGAWKFFFDQATRRRVLNQFENILAIKSLERYLKMYVVIGDDGCVITAGHLTCRVQRN